MIAAGVVLCAPWSAIPLAPVVLLVGLVGLGSWKLLQLHQELQPFGDGSGLSTVQRRQLDDDCELATFAALQEAAQFVQTARELLGDGPRTSPLLERCRRLEAELDAFVFTGNGMGDLAAAWALEDTTRHLACEASDRRWRPAA